jgi:hypothetical protein
VPFPSSCQDATLTELNREVRGLKPQSAGALK